MTLDEQWYLAFVSQPFDPEPVIEECFDAFGLPPRHLIKGVRSVWQGIY